MTEQGAVGDFYDLRAFTTFAIPSSVKYPEAIDWL
jgi:hypothetical protein